MADTTLPPLAQLDPQEAWKPWQPDAGNPWNLKWAAHLYRRAAFGVPAYDPKMTGWESLQQAVRDGLEPTLAKIEQGGPGLAEFDGVLNDLAPHMGKGTNRFEQEAPKQQIRGWWLYAMLFSPHPLRERMTLFWHNHFATSIAKVRRHDLMVKQNQTLRSHALGKFRPTLLALSKDPAMLLWLDSNSNVKGYPNENYARELMELFSLGTGNYTEMDVKAAARAFTGWHTDGQEFTFNEAQHDGEAKTYLGQTGNWDGGDVVRIILERPAAARFLVRKLYRQFISESEPPPDALLEPLAEQLRRSDYDMGAVVRTILRSRLFFSEHAYRRRIKSPVEYVVSLLRGMDERMDMTQLASVMTGLGQDLFAPPNVKGWDGGKAWLNTATLLARHNLAWSMLSTAPSSRPSPSRGGTFTFVASKVGGDQPGNPRPVELVRKHGGKEATQQVAFLVDLLLGGDVDPAARQKLEAFLKQGEPKDKNQEQRIRETMHTILLMPEYQLA
jgi:hypothetical protein